MTTNRFSLPKASLLTLLMTGASANSLGIYAAAAQEDNTVSRQKTITVTATRRDESLVDVPYNISAVTGADIEAASIIDEAELLRSIPGVAVVDRGARNSGTLNSARIRGLAVDSNGLFRLMSTTRPFLQISCCVTLSGLKFFAVPRGLSTDQGLLAAQSATLRATRT